MKKTQKQFLNILKLFVEGKAAELNTDTNIEELLKLGQIHNLLPVLGYALNGYIENTASDSKKLTDLSDIFFKTVVYQYNRLDAFESLLDILSQNQIKVILMKGCVINRYYPAKEVRTFGDIDFLIEPEQREAVDNLLCSLGYERTVAEKTVWSYFKGEEKYEVHTALLPNENVLSEEMNRFIAEAFVSGVPTARDYIFELSPSYHFVFLLLHIAKHMKSTGAGVRMYLDLALMIKNEENLDFEYIQKKSEMLNISKFLSASLNLCKEWFGTEASVDLMSVDAENLSLMQEYVISAGVFGRYDRNPAVARIRNTDKGVSRLLALKSYVFPSYEDTKGAYAWLNGRPYLLPAAWLARLYDGMFLRRNKAVKIFKGMFTEGENAKITDRMLKGIGLEMRLK